MTMTIAESIKSKNEGNTTKTMHDAVFNCECEENDDACVEYFFEDGSSLMIMQGIVSTFK